MATDAGTLRKPGFFGRIFGGQKEVDEAVLGELLRDTGNNIANLNRAQLLAYLQEHVKHHGITSERKLRKHMKDLLFRIERGEQKAAATPLENEFINNTELRQHVAQNINVRLQDAQYDSIGQDMKKAGEALSSATSSTKGAAAAVADTLVSATRAAKNQTKEAAGRQYRQFKENQEIYKQREDTLHADARNLTAALNEKKSTLRSDLRSLGSSIGYGFSKFGKGIGEFVRHPYHYTKRGMAGAGKGAYVGAGAVAGYGASKVMGAGRAVKDVASTGLKALAPGIIGWFVVLGLFTHFIIDWGWQAGFNGRFAMFVTPMTVMVDVLFALFMWLIVCKMRLKYVPGILFVLALEVGWLGWLARTLPFLVENPYTGFLFAKFFWPYWAIFGIVLGEMELEIRPHDHRLINLCFVFVVLFWFFTLVPFKSVLGVAQLGQISSDLATDDVLERWQQNTWVNPFAQASERMQLVLSDPIKNGWDFGASAVEEKKQAAAKAEAESYRRYLTSVRDQTLLDNTTFEFRDTTIVVDPINPEKAYARTTFAADSPKDPVEISISCEVKKTTVQNMEEGGQAATITLNTIKKVVPGQSPILGDTFANELSFRNATALDVQLGCRAPPNLEKGSYYFVFKAEVRQIDSWGFLQVLYAKPEEVEKLKQAGAPQGIGIPDKQKQYRDSQGRIINTETLTSDQYLLELFSYYGRLFTDSFGTENVFVATYPENRFAAHFTNKPVIGDIYFSWESPIVEIAPQNGQPTDVDWNFVIGNAGMGKVLKVSNMKVGMPKGMVPVEGSCGAVLGEETHDELTYYTLGTSFSESTLQDINNPKEQGTGKKMNTFCYGKIPDPDEFFDGREGGFYSKRTEFRFTADYLFGEKVFFEEKRGDYVSGDVEFLAKSTPEIIASYGEAVQLAISAAPIDSTSMMTAQENRCMLYAIISAASKGNPEYIDAVCGGRIGLTGLDGTTAVTYGADAARIYESASVLGKEELCFPKYATWIAAAKRVHSGDVKSLDVRFDPVLSITYTQAYLRDILKYITEQSQEMCLGEKKAACAAAAYRAGTCVGTKGALCVSESELCSGLPNYLCKDAWEGYGTTINFVSGVKTEYDLCMKTPTSGKDAIPPGAATDVFARLSRDGKQTIVTWKPSPDDPALGGTKDVQRYSIIIKNSAEAETQNGEMMIGKRKGDQYVAAVSVVLDQQSVVIRTWDLSGNSKDSQASPIAQVNKEPEKINGFSAQTDEQGRVLLSWDKSPDDAQGEADVSSYQICEYTGTDSSCCDDPAKSSASCKILPIVSAEGKETYTYGPFGVKAGQAYNYKICAKDAPTICGPYTEPQTINIPVPSSP